MLDNTNNGEQVDNSQTATTSVPTISPTTDIKITPPQTVQVKVELTKPIEPKKSSFKYKMPSGFKVFYPYYAKKIDNEVNWLLEAQKDNLTDKSEVCLERAREIKKTKETLQRVSYLWIVILVLCVIATIICFFLSIAQNYMIASISVGGVAIIFSFYTSIGLFFLDKAPLSMLELENEQRLASAKKSAK